MQIKVPITVGWEKSIRRLSEVHAIEIWVESSRTVGGMYGACSVRLRAQCRSVQCALRMVIAVLAAAQAALGPATSSNSRPCCWTCLDSDARPLVLGLAELDGLWVVWVISRRLNKSSI